MILDTTEFVPKKQLLQNTRNDASIMSKLNSNNCCAWKLVLNELKTDKAENDWLCGICSYQSCNPNGDHPVNYSLSVEVCYTSKLEGYSVYALGKGSETVSFNSNVISNICLRFIPDINSPTEWAITFIPDSSRKNAEIIDSIAKCLNGLPVVNFISINKKWKHLKMVAAKSDGDKNDVLKKYLFDVGKLLGFRKLLIYDDCINTGKTIMNAIQNVIRNFKISEIRILVNTIYESNCPPRQIELVDLST